MIGCNYECHSPKKPPGLGFPYCSHVDKDNSTVQVTCFHRVMEMGQLMNPLKISWMKYSSDLLNVFVSCLYCEVFLDWRFRCALIHLSELWLLVEVVSYNVTENVTF